MPTPSGHTTAIPASKVQGATVKNSNGEKIGHVEDVVLDKMSNRIMFGVLSFGGFLGMGEKYHPVPWSLLDYSKEEGAYVVPLSKDVLEAAPAYDIKELTANDGAGGIREKSYEYYNVEADW